ncbi:MAG TPA: hypothetical protein VMJ66_05645 [Geobacteraceae bacterium]|nr:hypothetical protein [Geobacteraceae bacterium]
MAKKDVAGFVCRPFCSFYREGVKEELICNGARLVEMLLDKGILSQGQLSAIEPSMSIAARKNRRMAETVCAPCPFIEDGCDFRAKVPPPGAVPCGGYILLGLLLAKNMIAMEALKESGDG